MYESHWGLQSRPFDNRADSRFYYPSESHQAALLKLHYAIENRRAVAVVCGDSGLGKTMLLDTVASQLPELVSPTVRVVYPAMPPEQLLRYIARQMAPQEGSDTFGGIGQSIETIERMLRHNVGDNQHALISIDEAHLLESFGSLEPLRLLLNLATELSETETAMTLILSGSSNLLAHLARHTALEDRISVRCVLERFDENETTAYIQHRLKVAGWTKPLMFDDEAISAIQELTLGAPRRINRLCDLALMVAFAQDRSRVDRLTIENANSELSARVQAA
jgi:type II secretory pathway predicted ATPase ExeA